MSHDEKTEKKSPLKDNPLRQPGQSAQDRIWDLAFDKLVTPAMIALILGFASFLEVSCVLGRKPSFFTAGVYVAAFIGSVIFVISRWRRTTKEIAALKLGRDGERAVAEVLTEQIRKGNAVFHDIVGPSFNLDHVIVASQGIYIIETKTISKPTKRPDAVVSFDGTTLLVDRRPLGRDPIAQSLSQIRWLRDVLRESTGTDLPVKGIVVFPGWFVKNDNASAEGKVWVMNPKGIDGFISAGRSILPAETVHLVSFHLSRFIRSQTTS